MVTWREGAVVAVRSRRPGAVEYAVRLAPADGSPSPVVTAVGYGDLVGEAAVGDRVLLTTDALDLGLGTGGVALVAAVPDRLPASLDGSGHRHCTDGRAHVVKARYTPAQPVVHAVEDHGSPHHDLLAEADSLGGMPVVVAELHSAVPAVLAGLRNGAAGARVTWAVTDEAALPVAFSRTVAALCDAGWLAGVVTTGQAFGGDLEAVTLHSGLLAARHVLQADVAVVAPGPGTVGTGTRWGFTGVAVGEAVNAVGVLGGRAVGTLRVSGADPRERHRGVSHHSRTAYGRVALAEADLPVPRLAGALHGLEELESLVRVQVEELVGQATAPLTAYDIRLDGLLEALRACPAPLVSMGRTLEEDPAAFLAAAAAGRHAATLLGPG